MNEPAFPVAFKWGEDFKEYNGMTLRDYFAAKAMQGFASNLGPGATFETRAAIAYQWADKMMEARNVAQ